MTKGIFGKWAATRVLTLVLFVFSVMVSSTAIIHTANAQDITADSANWALHPMPMQIFRPSTDYGRSGFVNGGTFVDLPPAAPVHNIRYVSAVFFANDANKNIFNPDVKKEDGEIDSQIGPRDGAVNTDFGAGLLMRDFVPFFSDDKSPQGKTRQGPIIANIESSDANDPNTENEKLHIVAIIENVDPAIVTLIKNEPLGGTTAQSIISKITAEISKQLFTEGESNPFASVHPNSVTGVIQSGSTSSDIGLTDPSNSVGQTDITAATMLLIHWDPSVNTALVASASLRTRAGEGASGEADGAYNATITINGGKISPTNLIGIEVNGYTDVSITNPFARPSGPDIVYNAGGDAKPNVTITKFYDTVSKRFVDGDINELNYLDLASAVVGTDIPYVTQFLPTTSTGSLDSSLILFDGSDNNPASGTQNSGNPVQYRASDVVVIDAKFNINANLDGEPNAYFGKNSDPIAMGELIKENLAKAKDANASYINLETTRMHLNGVLDSNAKIENASSKISLTIKSKVDDEDINIKKWTLIGVQEHGYDNGAGSDKIITVTFPVSTSLITSTQHEQFSFQLTVQDDIGYATTTFDGDDAAARKFYVDTIGPELTDLTLEADGRDTSIASGDIGYQSQRRFSNNGDTNAMFVNISVAGNGENSAANEFYKWANISIDHDPGRNLKFNSSTYDNINFATLSTSTDIDGPGNEMASVVQGASSAFVIPGIAGDPIIGVSGTVKFFHTSTAFINSNTAQVVVSVSDDARNPAISWGTDFGDGDETVSADFEKLIGAATRAYGIKTIGGATKVPFVNISSASTNIVVLNNGLTGTAVYKTINPSTLAIDNNPPSIMNATLTVTGMPTGYFHDLTDTDDIQTRFNLLFTATEALSHEPNIPYIIENGSAALASAPDNIKHYYRATAKVNNITKPTDSVMNNGSPLRLIVQFDVDGIDMNEPVDMDAMGWHKSNEGVTLDLAAFKSYFTSNFTVQLAAPGLGFVTDTSKNLPNDWTIVGASIGNFTVSGTNRKDIAFVTLETSTGIVSSASYAPFSTTQSLNGASITVTISDRVGNYSQTNSSPNEIPQSGVNGSIAVGKEISSTTIIVDVSAPTIGGFGDKDQIGYLGPEEGEQGTDQIINGTAIDGEGNPLNGNVILLVTNTNNVSFLELVDKFNPESPAYDEGVAENIPNTSAPQWFHIGNLSRYADASNGGEVGAPNWTREDGFINTRDAALTDPDQDNDKVAPVQSGYMIIISTTFTEAGSQADVAPARDILTSFNVGVDTAGDNYVGAFPYFISAASSNISQSTTGVYSFGNNLNGHNYDFGAEFKSISADFSDFVVGAKAVLPQVSRSIIGAIGYDHAYVASTNASVSTIVEATWFYLIGSDANVNTSLGSGDVRSVTIYARDLSGNVSVRGVRVATANFSVPSVAIEALKISIPSRGYSDLAIQGTGTSAQSISAATFNLNDATLTLVAKISNSFLVNQDGHPPITANFTSIGGGAGVVQNSTSTNTTASTISEVSSGTIVYATWEVGPFNPDTKIANRTAKITVTATGTSLTAGQAQTSNIDTDQKVPTFPTSGYSNTAETIVERTLGTNPDTNKTNVTFDTFGDDRFRPGQIFSVSTTVKVNSDETEGDGTSGNAMSFTADMSDFGLGKFVEPTIVIEDVDDGNDGPPDAPAGDNFTKIVASWQQTIPSNATTNAASIIIRATDPAGNTATKSTNIVFVQTARPQIVNTVLSASTSIGLASETFFELNSFKEVGTTDNNGTANRASTYATAENTYRVFKNGDQLKIESNVLITDDAFTDIIVTADVSNIFTDGPTRQNVGLDEDSYLTILGATQVYPTDKTKGNNINAEWIIGIHNAKDSGSTPQSIIINATVGDGAAFSSTGNATMTIPIIMDTIAPEVTLDYKWFKNGKEISEADLFSSSPNGATAQVIAYATFTDADSLRGYIGSVVKGSYATSESNTAATGALITLDARDFGDVDQATPQITNITPGLWVISDRTGALTDTTNVPLVTSGSSFVEIGNATGNVLTAWFGEVPAEFYNAPNLNDGSNNKRIQNFDVPQITVTKVNANNADIVVSVSDSVGNIGTASTNKIEADGTAPTVQKNPFRLKVVDGTKHWPAYYTADGEIISNTRVGNGSMFNAFITLYDNPDKSDHMIVTVTGNDFGASLNEITALATEDISAVVSNGAPYAWTFTATPSNASDVTLTATFTAGSKGINYQPIDTSENDGTPNAPADGFFDWGYSTANTNSASKGFFINGASIGITVIDSENNTTGHLKSTTLDYDNEGPKLNIGSDGKSEATVLIVNSITEVNNVSLSTEGTVKNRANNVQNAETSNWLVMAGTVIVDGTNDEHLSAFSIDWANALEQDIGRLVVGSETTGNHLITTASQAVPSARALRFVTNAVQIRSNASPSGAVDVKAKFADFFGNETESTITKVAINASGPTANEIRLFVNGVSQLSGTQLLGIGNSGPDSASSSFELAPGDKIEVEAVINTVGSGRAPQFIYANFASLYPPELLHSVDEIVPNATSITADGTVLAKWNYIAADYRLLTASNSIHFNDVQFTSGSVAGDGDGGANYATKYKNGIIAGVTIETATAISLTDNGAINSLSLTQTILDNIQGLPEIYVQQNANPTMSASIAVFIDESAPLNLFGSTNPPSSKFAVDTQTPITSWYVPWELITRVQSPPLSGFVGYDKDTGQIDPNSSKARIGFPTTPRLTVLDNIDDSADDLNSIYNIPARVSGGDTVYIIANVTNPNISKNGDDRFRPYPGDTFNSSTLFTIDSSNVDIHADLSDFGGSTYSNVSILGSTTGTDASPAFNVLTKNQNYEGKATQISATYALTISNDEGTDVTSSRRQRDATFTVTDDAGNKPYDTFETIGNNQTENGIKRLVRPGAIGIDNRAPTISGTLDVIELSPNTGATLQNGSAIVGGSKLRIEANINDSVDNPLDVLNNSNWGNVTLTAFGIQLTPDDVILLATEAQLTGNSVTVPFSVDIPAIETGISTSEFQFIISATDSIGNTTSRLSNDKFKFDARPDVKWADATGTTIESQVTFHAGGPALVVSANSFDVGGVSDVVIQIDGSDAASQLPVLAENGITYDSTFSGSGGTGIENVNVPITITSVPEIGVTPFTFIVASVTDISGATNEAQIVVNYNRPALFAADFALTAVNSAGTDIAPATVISGSGSLETEGDVREITVTEGSTVTVTLAASDADGDGIIYSATGSAFDAVFEDSVYDATTNVFTFKPGYKALTGEETTKTFEAVFTANDGKHPTSDVTTISITVTEEAAVPVIDIQSIAITNLRDNSVSTAEATENDTVSIPENTSVEMVVVATDAGNENLVFTTTPDTDLVVATQITNSTGIATATVTFNLGFEDADIVISESALDPTLLTFSAANGTNTGSVTKVIDITNSSQPGVITSTFTRNGGTAQTISDGSSVTAAAGDVIVFDVITTDPDLIDRFDFPVVTYTTDNPAFNISSQFVDTNETGTIVESSITVVVASEITEDTSATINYSVQKDTLDAILSSATFYVTASSTPPPPVVQVDEMVIAQGAGGSQLVNIRNFDSNSATPVNGIIDQFRSVGPNAITAWGGGAGRGTYVTVGDADNDSDLDYVMTFGPVSEAAVLPNIFVPMDVATKTIVGIAPHAFPAGGPIGYATGNLTSAIGDFMVDGTNQVAVAQGLGSDRSLVRIFEYTGLTGPGSWKVVAQFQPLDNTPNNNNANGGVSLDAADVDGDGLSELIVGQTASATSLTQFTVIDVDPTLNANGVSNGAHVRHNFVAFAAGFRGGGGVDIAAADLNSDGVTELVFTSGPLNGSTELGSLVTVVRPVVTSNVVTGYERPGSSIVQLVAGDSNPGGGLSVAAGEFDGDDTNGQELLIGSGADAPQSFYRVVKVSYDGTDVTGTTFLIGPPNNFAFTQPAFLGNFNPTSGAVNVEAANHTVRN